MAAKRGNGKLLRRSCTLAGLAALEAAIESPQDVRGVFVTNISLRMLHASKQSRCIAPVCAELCNVP